MKNTFETDASRKTNFKRWLAWSAGLLLLGLSVWTACGCLAFQRAHHAHNGRSCCNWYQRCQLEARQIVSIVNYLLTPEEDVGVFSAFVDPKLTDSSVPGAPPSTTAAGTANVDAASGVAECQ